MVISRKVKDISRPVGRNGISPHRNFAFPWSSWAVDVIYYASYTSVAPTQEAVSDSWHFAAEKLLHAMCPAAWASRVSFQWVKHLRFLINYEWHMDCKSL